MTLTPEERAFLDEPHFAVVATVGSDGRPHQTVMWYVREGDDLLLSTPAGSLKHRHLEHDRRLSVCVEDAFRYLTLSGTVQLVDEPPDEDRARYQSIGARYLRAAPPPGDAPPDPKVLELLSRPRVTLRLIVDHVHGNGFGR